MAQLYLGPSPGWMDMKQWRAGVAPFLGLNILDLLQFLISDEP